MMEEKKHADVRPELAVVAEREPVGGADGGVQPAEGAAEARNEAAEVKADAAAEVRNEAAEVKADAAAGMRNEAAGAKAGGAANEADAAAAGARKEAAAGEEAQQRGQRGRKERGAKMPPVRYIKQPYPVSAMQADLSKQQIKILVGMMQSIQDGVQEMFERHHKAGGQLLLFPELEDDHVNIDFKFSDVVDRPDYYENVEKVAQKFVEMVFRYEDKEAGEVTLSHFVDEVTYPSKGSKRDKIRFSFTRKQAEKVFNFTMYSKYIQSVAFMADSKYTARLYMLITSARGYSTSEGGTFHWYTTYQELRRMLGCDVKEGGVWVRKSRRLYKHFKADILRVAEKELRQLADEGKSDCWFEFIELPEDFRGEPRSFDFVVHLSQMGLLEAERARQASRFHALRQYMAEQWGLSERECTTLLAPLGERSLGELEAKVKSLADWMRGRAEIQDHKRYAKKSIAQMVKDLTSQSSPAAAQSSAPAAAAPAEEEARREPSVGEVMDRWFRVLKPKDYQMYVRGLERQMEISHGTVYVRVGHAEVRDKLEGWRPLLERASGLKLHVSVEG